MKSSGTAGRGLVGAILVALIAMATAAPVQAEKGWVRGEIRLNIRTGPGTQYRIVGVAKTGDGVEVLTRTDNWTQIRLTSEDGGVFEGWIPEGYLKPQPPPTVRLGQAETRVTELEGQLGAIENETEKLRKNNRMLTTQDGDQQSQISLLTMENMELRAGARYPEWITGASIFSAGMILGAMLHRSSVRRQPSRIRL